MSLIHFITDLIRAPLRYVKYKGYYPEVFEKTIQWLALFNIIAVANNLSSAIQSASSLNRDIRHLDYRSTLSSIAQTSFSAFDSIRYMELFEKAVQPWSGASSLMVPQIGPLGKYVLVLKIFLGMREVYESYLFIQQFREANNNKLIQEFLEEQTGGGSDYSKERAFARNTSKNVLKLIQSYDHNTVGNDKVAEALQLSTKTILNKKVALIAINCIRLIALFFLQKAALASVFLFACKLSRPAIRYYCARLLKTISLTV